MTQYDKLKVAELKDLIKERGIASTGLKLKQNYIDALVADDGAKESGADGDEVEGKQEEAPAEAAVAEGKDGENEQQQAEDIVVTETTQVDEPPADDTENVNKRKRRSPTPPVREDSVSKKLKVAEEKEDVHVNLPEDAPVPVDEEAQEQIKPFATSDDVMQVDNAEELAGDIGADNDDAKEPQEAAQIEQQDQTMDDIDPDAPPSRLPPTCALYIRELVRPLQPGNLRQHLLDTAQGATSDSANIEAFHVDKLRSHAFVLFDSVSSASKVRTALHSKVWPDEPMRKALWVDFIPENKVQDFINVEVERGDMTRWEVVYDDTDGPILQEAESGGSGGPRGGAAIGPSRPAVGEGMPNAPLGPRRQSTQQSRPQNPYPQPEPSQQPESRGIAPLDELFNTTDAKPKIYYLPVARELAERRMEHFRVETAQDWNDADADPSAYAEGELRRYTFEDGDRLVDSGADFGLFGRRGRGGGFGGRGRGRGRAGDFYSGGRGGWRR